MVKIGKRALRLGCHSSIQPLSYPYLTLHLTKSASNLGVLIRPGEFHQVPYSCAVISLSELMDHAESGELIASLCCE